MIGQIAIVALWRLVAVVVIFAGGRLVFFKITSEVHEKLDSESSLPIACAVSLQEIF